MVEELYKKFPFTKIGVYNSYDPFVIGFEISFMFKGEVKWLRVNLPKETPIEAVVGYISRYFEDVLEGNK